jgi:hypothetical protein
MLSTILHRNAQFSGRKASRKRELLNGASLGSGVVALMLMANPQSAWAQCVVVAGSPNIVGCNNSFASSDATATNTTNPSATERHQRFTAGFPTNATIFPGVVISGAGQAISTEVLNSALNYNHQGAISLTTLPTAANSGGAFFATPFGNVAASALNLNANGGLITYTGNGTVSQGNQTVTAISIVNLGAGGVNMGTSATPITPIWTGFSGLITTTDHGDQNVFLDNGAITVTGNISSGVRQLSNTGTINTTITDGTIIQFVDGVGERATDAGNNLVGISGLSITGNVTINANARIGTATGAAFLGINVGDIGFAQANPNGGNATINLTGGQIFANGIGINAHVNGAVNITTDAGSKISMVGPASTVFDAGSGVTSLTGIRAVSATSSVTVTVNGVIDPPVIGVDAQAAGAATVHQNTDLVATDIGVRAVSTGIAGIGGGLVTVDGTGNIATTGTAATSTIIASATGTTGSVHVGGTGTTTFTGTAGRAIDAQITNAANNGSITVDRSGTLNSTAQGIFAKTIGSGFISINTGTNAGVTAGTGDAIHAETATGVITVATHGPVSSVGGFGINVAQTGTGPATGDVTVTTTGTGPVTGATGISATAVDGAAVSIDSRGGLVTGNAPAAGAPATGTGNGIFARSTNGAIGIQTVAVTSVNANGIEAQTASGAITITTAGNVGGGVGTATQTQYGILAQQLSPTASAGNISITTGGTVVAGTGIAALAQGPGPNGPSGPNNANITIDTSAGKVTANGPVGGGQGAGDGVYAGNVGGSISVTTAAVESVNRAGIEAASGSGAVSVTTKGAVTGGTSGIAAGTTNADMTINTGGAVIANAANIGISVFQTGLLGGNVLVTTGGTVTGGAGIAAVNYGGNLSIDSTAGSVTSNGANLAGSSAQGGNAGYGVVSNPDAISAQTIAGTINITTGAVTGGGSAGAVGNAIEAYTFGGGGITIATHGQVQATFGTGILATQTGATATGNILITTTAAGVLPGGPVTSLTGISATAIDGASITVDSRGGTVTGNGILADGLGFGIRTVATTGAIIIDTAAVQSTNAAGTDAVFAQTGGAGISAGAITIHAHGAVTSAAGAGITAIQLAGSTSGGNILISNVGTGPITGATFGIDTQAVGNDSITLDTQGGKITGLANDGIRAQSANGAIRIETVAVSGNESGINAQSGLGVLGATNSGAITIITHDAVNGGTTANTFGINASQRLVANGNGNISVNTTGPVIGNGGINAAGVGNAGVTVNTVNSPLVTGTGTAANGGVGINATSDSGNILVNTAAVTATNAGATAVNAQSAFGGSVTVTVAAGSAINGSDIGTGITATTAGGNGNASVTTGDSVTAGIGINAAAVGNGSVTVNSTAGLVTGQNLGAILTTAGAGATNVTTAAVTGATDGIFSNSTGGPIAIITNGQVQAGADVSNTGIFASQDGGNGNVSVTNNNTVNGYSAIFALATGSGNTTVTTAAGAAGNVTGTGGFGIQATGVNGAITVNANAQRISGASDGGGIVTNGFGSGTTTINVSSATLVSGGTNLGAQTAAGITANSTASGAIVINNNGQCSVLNCQFGVLGLGNTFANAAIAFSNTIGTVTINNNAGAFIGSNLLPSASVTAWAIANTNGDATGSNVVNNASTIIGRVQTGGGNDFFYNYSGSHWALAGAGEDGVAADFAAGVDTLSNQSSNSIYISGPLSNMNGLEIINNTGTIHAGNAPCEAAATAGCTVGSQVNFNATAGLAQTVVNSSFMNINGHTTFNSTAAAGSSFLNTSGGVIDMSLFQTGTLQPIGVPPAGTPAFPASTHITTDYLALNATTAGSSDLNYTYAFGTSYNYTGAGDNRAYLDTNIGAPGTASDRMIVSGTATGRTNLYLWDTSTTPGGTFNPTGITLAAVNGPSSNAFFLGGQTNPLHQSPGAYNDQYLPDFGPMGAIKKGLFVSALLQAPLPGSPAGSRYALFTLPDIEAFQLPIITTAAQNIFFETAVGWLDHQDEVRNWMRYSKCRQGLIGGSGADLLIKAPVCQLGGPGAWMKAIGSWTDRNVTQSLGGIAAPASVLTPFDLGYRQSTYALYGGVDFATDNFARPYDVGIMGLMGGYIESRVTFKNSPTRFDFTGGTVGISGTYINGGFFADGLLKADVLEMKASLPTLTAFAIPSQSLQVVNAGVLANIGYRWDFSRLFYLEPIGSASYVSTHVNNFGIPGTSVQFSNGQSLRAAVGVRTGVNWLETAAYQIDTSMTAKLWGEFLGSNPVNFISVGGDPNVVPLTLNDKVSRAYGELAAQANFTHKGSGWSGFLNASTRFNDQFTTVSGRTGIRFQW